jgi:IMP cyclohydrolase
MRRPLVSIYLGRIVAVGRTPGGRNAAAYRVSSRSFPNRQVAQQGEHLAVVPREGHEGDVLRNPYIAYNCVRRTGRWAILTNGSQTDPVTEKLQGGMSPKDALALSLLALDYEKDHLKTPRIATVVHAKADTAWLAIVRCDALVVKEVPLMAGQMHYLATYEANNVRREQTVPISVESADALARAACDCEGFATFTNPVTAAAVVAEGEAFALGRYVVGA